MTRNLSCSIPCPANTCRACDLERKAAPSENDRPTLDLTIDDLEPFSNMTREAPTRVALADQYIPDPVEEDFQARLAEKQAQFAAFTMPRLKVEPGYELLAAILDEALEQAQAGKGKERHANDDPFHDQPIIHLNLNLGSSDGALYQAQKKLIESKRLPPARRKAERLGAINYIVASVIIDEDLDEQAERKKERS